MARREQSSSGFNVSGFDGVEMSVDLGERRRRPRAARRAGGLGVANGAVAVIADGLKLVLQGPAVVTVLAPKLCIDRVTSGPTSPVPAPRRRTVLDKDYSGHD